MSSWKPIPVAVAAGTGKRTYEIANFASDTQYCVKLNVIMMNSTSPESGVTSIKTKAPLRPDLTLTGVTYRAPDVSILRKGELLFSICNVGQAASTTATLAVNGERVVIRGGVRQLVQADLGSHSVTPIAPDACVTQSVP